MADATVPTTDPRWVPHTDLSAIDRWFLARIRNERDLIFPRVALRLTLILVPLALALYLAPWWLTLAAAPFYWAVVFLGLCGRYTLMLHATCHRVLFKRQHTVLDKWIPWFLGPFFGMTPTSFFVHHMGMHHPENNLETDLSSTMGYQRDNFLHFLHYWARFFLFGYLHVPRYFAQRGRDKLRKQFLYGEIAWLVGIVALFALDWSATLVVFFMPFCFIRFFMMCGNWAQHSFVDIDDPANPYRNSTCLINTRYNHKAYNDGYHIVHHIKPNLHWADMAVWYEDHIEEFGRNDAVVFSAIGDNQVVFWNLMLHRYDFLASKLVDLPGQKKRSHEEKVAWLKVRTRRQGYPMKGVFENREDPARLATPAT